ncbi:MAG TPA: IS91 family transposase [Gemmataceae bacterium]|nr:IS91 family transposase [Gemmataceae bacterium]
MPDPGLDIGAILDRAEGRNGLPGLNVEQRRAVEDLSACRTAALGGRVEQCSCCGAREYLYNSCRNRHCPKCQANGRAEWLDREASYLLPVEYHHLVFTLPAEVAELARHNPRLIYGLLFEAASAAVREAAANPKHLGAQVGLTAVLHTWGQTLSLHPHLHVMASGGGLSCNRTGEIDEPPTWRSCRPGFFLPVRVLGALFKGKFLAGLCQARQQGRLHPSAARAVLSCPVAWSAWLAVQRRLDWVVYSQPPSAGAAVVLKYLARYTYRVAISNSRLLSVSDEAVTFSYKDYRHGGKQRRMTLSVEEFARRFLQHVLPRGFVRVRHYGLLANRGREVKLLSCRRLLLAEPARARQTTAAAEEQPRRCPACGEGVMCVVEVIAREPRARPQGEDSS